ncbi:winged helix-turn-helix transcriptional regulator [Bifidobacterium sp. 64T4]|nr:winged helix-turn-helix transcriptional regulator [Bifidobacterium pongonis]
MTDITDATDTAGTADATSRRENRQAPVGADIRALAGEFERCQRALTALGNPTRLHLITSMLQAAPRPEGLRVGEITERTNLSRPAVSHHLKILKDAGIVHVRHEGTRNYYTLDAEPAAIDELIAALTHARRYATDHTNHNQEEQHDR